MEFIKVIEKRKSVRNFIDKSIDKDKIDYVLNAARLSPSWMNKQCWQFIIVKDKEIIKEIAKGSIINRWLKKTPVIIVACADPFQSGKRDEVKYYLVDTAIAMQSLILAATDIGLGTCWIGGFKEEKIKKLLEIPPRIKVVALTPLGYPSKDKSIADSLRKIIVRSTKRKSISEITHLDKW